MHATTHAEAEPPSSSQGRKHQSASAATVGLLAAIFLLMLALNLMTPTWGDDWHRSLPGGDWALTLQRIVWEYQTWSGRVSVLLLTYLALWQYPGTEYVFACVNALAFHALLLGMFWTASSRFPGQSRGDVLTLIAAFGAVWLYVDAFGEAVLWKTGAVGFMWVIAATLFLSKPFIDLLCDGRLHDDTAVRRYALPPLYMFGAATLENLAAATAMLLVGALLWQKCVRRGPLPRWYLIVTIGYLCGSALLLAAPGSYTRFAMNDDGMPLYGRLLPLARRIWEQGSQGTGVFYLLPALALAALLLRVPATAMRRAGVMLVYGLASAMAMAGSPGISFGARTAFCSEVLFVTAAVTLFHAIHAMPRSRLFSFACTGLLMVFLLPDVMRTVHQYRSTWMQTQRREALMDLYHLYGLKRPFFPSYRIPFIDGLHDDLVRGRYFLRDIHPDIPGNGWRNGSFAAAYGFEFALRVEQPYLVFEPELAKNRPGLRVEYEAAGLRVLSRIEPGDFAHHRVAYVIAESGNCNEAATLATSAGLNYAWHFNDTALVAADGQVSTQQCIVRGT